MMAITWDTKIDVINFDERRINISATRTDDADPDNPVSGSAGPVTIKENAQRVEVLQTLSVKAKAKVTSITKI